MRRRHEILVRAPLAAGTARRFELKESLTPGETVEAYPLDDQDAPITDSSAVFEVTDARGVYRGRAKDQYASPHNQGSRGEAVWRRGRWEIDWLTPHALAIRGELTADLETTAETFTIDAVDVLQPEGAIIVDQDPAQPITVNNKFTHEGNEDGLARADWNQTTAEWDSLQTQCKE